METRQLIEEAFEDRSRLADSNVCQAIHAVMGKLDAGLYRVAEKREGKWEVNVWLKKTILLYFAITDLQSMEAGPLSFHDKIPIKKNLAQSGVRVVPPGTIRFGAYVEQGAVVMPGYVNIGAWVGSGTMVDTWATVGSCAQVGRNVHLSGGVGIGGVLEPPNAFPVIIEDNCFVGSRSILVEGVVVEEECIIGANVCITASTPIVDVTGSEEVVHKGRVPARSVVIPGTRKKSFPAGEYGVPCALIIGRRTAAHDKNLSLNQALRDFGVPV